MSPEGVVTPDYTDPLVTLFEGDCLPVMRELPADSVDAVVTDPPYFLRFMGRKWDDSDSPQHQEDLHKAWATEAFRVLKPGGYLVAFGGDRTVHRLASAVEDAGFEIRGQLTWIHAQGFPKSRNVSADLELLVPVDARCVCESRSTRIAQDSQDGYRPERGFDGERPPHGGGSDLAPAPSPGGAHGRIRGGRRKGARVEAQAHSLDLASSDPLPIGDSSDPLELRSVDSPSADTVQSDTSSSTSSQDRSAPDSRASSRSHTLDSEPGLASSWEPPAGARFAYSKCTTCDRWKVLQGLGTALKPAHEPIVMVRKPLVGTVAANVTRYGTGALNIGATRIGTTEVGKPRGDVPGRTGDHGIYGKFGETGGSSGNGATNPAGRWPSNVLLSDPELFDEPNPGVVGSGATTTSGLMKAGQPKAGESVDIYGARDGYTLGQDTYADSGGYSRFFLVPKAPKQERMVNGQRGTHPTQKPVDLMRHLLKLVTPPGGVALDPFAGSGTTGVAASLEGIRSILIEREAEYVEQAKGRLMATPMGLGLEGELRGKVRKPSLNKPTEWKTDGDGIGDRVAYQNGVGARKAGTIRGGYDGHLIRPRSPKPVDPTAPLWTDDEEPAA